MTTTEKCCTVQTYLPEQGDLRDGFFFGVDAVKRLLKGHDISFSLDMEQYASGVMELKMTMDEG